MQISKALADLMNAQVGNELGASNQYLQIASYFDGESLSRLAKFFYDQAEEEREHAMKFVHYLMDVGAELSITAIPATKTDIGSAEKAFEMSLGWEQEVTGQINAMMDLAIQEKDYASQAFLQWFVTEQVEEVSTMESMLQVVRKAGEKNLLMVEAYLTHRE
ncbi:MAG: ferritin [Anaerolineales bacterium]|nr:ferritin [Anaerolineales bacterium]